ncbi:ComF family protein [Pseudomonas typographi]|uniref:ComF family protein n=1 Tax=Pseudomonas typographi TaxID=2715964 RepID=A0ABR7YVH8_9PSED|nr:ComF family protein [Pseudomonas typographi]MBD1552183.1 ComF family protein [Pseudomonas typographi]MBD1585155.1 ComF family protein [Pseudomonas typographi]MBD1597202.1 ComF family protein [Pseudomonas typographi]
MRCQPIRSFIVNIWSNNNQPCLLCDQPAGQALPLCIECEYDLPWLGDGCALCALPMPGSLCADCLLRPPPFTRVEAALSYGFPVDALITRFKHQARWPFGRLLGALLTRHLRHRYQEGLPRPTCLLPVPLAPKRLRRRGFNQAQMLAGWLGKGLGIAVAAHLLRRKRDTAAQQRLGFEARQHNLHGAFEVAPRAVLQGRHVALVDDVMTSGATARALARLLIDAGAQRVDVYCLARTPKPT